MISRRALFSLSLSEPPEPAGPGEPAEPLRARRSSTPAAPRPMVAVVVTFSCLNAKADFCATCVERCPIQGAVKVEGRRVVVDPTRCNGCGVCVPLCPAPGGAILLTPVLA